MNPFPVIIAAGVVAAVPPLRRRVAPVAKAVMQGSLGVVGATLGAAVGVADAVLNWAEKHHRTT